MLVMISSNWLASWTKKNDMSHVTKLILIMQFIINLCQGWYLITPTNLKYIQDIAKVSCRKHVLAGLVDSRSQRVWDFFIFLTKILFFQHSSLTRSINRSWLTVRKPDKVFGGGGGERGEGRGGLTGSG